MKGYYLRLAASTFAVVTIAWGFHLSRADAPAPAPLPVEIIHTVGQPAQIRWKDGRVAEIQRATNPPLILPLRFEVTENTCNERTGVICTYRLPLLLDRMALVWTQHPDASRIGKPVKVHRPNENARDLTNDFISTTGDRLLYPKFSAAIPPDEIVCDDYSWILGAPGAGAPESFDVARWEYELMEMNPETGMQENRTNGGAHGLHFTRTASGSLQLATAQYFTGDGASLALFFGDISGLVVRQPDGEFCQYSLKASLGEVTGLISNYFGRANQQYRPYLLGSDELTKFAISNELYSVFNYGNDGVVTEAEVE